MIRFILGIFIVLGTVGADDFATEAGIQGPPLMQTLFWCLLGIALVGSAIPKLIRQGHLG